MSTWFQSVKDGLIGQKGTEKQRVHDDPFGFSVPSKPRFLLSPIFERLIAKTSIPEDQQKLLESLAQKGVIVYALRHRSQLDFVYVSLRLYQLGLPTPTYLFDLRPYFGSLAPTPPRSSSETSSSTSAGTAFRILTKTAITGIW